MRWSVAQVGLDKPRSITPSALLGVVMVAYVNGVSTRKVDHLVSELGIHMSKDVWKPTQVASGLDIRPHECRHGYGTHLRAAGVNDADLPNRGASRRDHACQV